MKAQAQQEKIIVFRGGEPGQQKRPNFISQELLVRERLESLAASRAMRQLEATRSEIRRMLEAGYPIEDGPHSANLEDCFRKAYDVVPSHYTKLVIR